MKINGLTVLVILIFVGLVLLVFGMAAWTQRPATIEADSILELDLTQSYPELAGYSPFGASFFELAPTLGGVVDALDRAARDDKVVALVARFGVAPMGLGTAQELRDAIGRFRASGKPAIAYADTFGEWGPANVAYYIASGFDRIYLQPSGDVSLTGLLYETPFYSGLFEKLDVVPRMGQRYEYKNAVNTYTETDYTEPHREAMQALADSQFEQILDGIAEGRGLARDQLTAAIDRGLFLGGAALEQGLVDELAYRDSVYAALEEEHPGSSFVQFNKYVGLFSKAPWRQATQTGTKVALIYGVGAVVRGESGYDPFSGVQSMGGDAVAAAFRDAIEDSNVKAILFRVNSPGGSYVASDTIWRETIRAREAGKPVVVSMGDVAASGGYFVAMAADAIVAQPGTITGSIGVYGGKLLSRGFWNKVGISFDDVQTADHATLWSSNHDFDEGGWGRIEASLDRIYEDFTGKVAEGRSMSREAVHEVARGRVWTGADALEIGLVDELGGLDVARDRIRDSLDLEAGAKLNVVVFPRAKTPFELLSEGRFVAASERTETWSRARVALRPLIPLARELGLLGEPRGALSVWPEIATPEEL